MGEGWRETWHERMERTPPYVEAWLDTSAGTTTGGQGSVCEDYGQIEAPVYAVGGWADGYSNAVPRLVAGLPGPRKGLVGPWSHAFPQDGEPGPTIGFLQECLRWWDHWLKGIDTGIMDEPRAARLDPGRGAPGRSLQRAAGPLGDRGASGPRRRSRRVSCRCRANFRPASPAPSRPARTPARGVPTAVRATGPRPARGGRPFGELHVRTARGAARHPRLSRRRADARVGSP